MKKLNKKKGFTLAELLVVVAIIAVLVAISIPIFTSQLDKARKATNEANLRAAKGAAVSEYLSTAEKTTDKIIYDYNIEAGTITAVSTAETEKTISEISTAQGNALYTKISVTVSGSTVTLAAE
ncbi:MAG: prepilin-type N-terminal cleavage/methylation domain-containing protein [Solobacterium sp.]|nr:prepilin-type N-terminal cleavage/methylation domain-containing protein [Solobacterium sp.]MCH4204858.1 prepilin-type N-terminal cleavage/methylation domain-containing protein [Solobacterium sp.]MCH4226482.1 prepilin-type N-terminal cleavage/methylation domain-containing protein [Solobacterium sp.]MCH4283046.1 prepilin-type N-terminal cleavage/methylation domain-containing protein [Solobacterium sp.]